MSEEAKVYTCSVCGKPTPNYHEWSPSVAAILGEQGSSTCDECFRKAQISYKWENEQFAEERLICPYCEISPRGLADELHDKMLLPLGVQVYCPDNGGSLRLRYDLSMRGEGSLREDSTLCLLWAMLMDSYTRWRTTGGVFVEASD